MSLSAMWFKGGKYHQQRQTFFRRQVISWKHGSHWCAYIPNWCILLINKLWLYFTISSYSIKFHMIILNWWPNTKQKNGRIVTSIISQPKSFYQSLNCTFALMLFINLILFLTPLLPYASKGFLWYTWCVNWVMRMIF